MTDEHDFDLIVIGSGPGGQKAPIQAAKLGARVAVVERRERVGGGSIHTGTIPSKASSASSMRRCSPFSARRSPWSTRARACSFSPTARSSRHSSTSCADGRHLPFGEEVTGVERKGDMVVTRLKSGKKIPSDTVLFAIGTARAPRRASTSARPA